MQKKINLVEEFEPGTSEVKVIERQQAWLSNVLVISSTYEGSVANGWVLTTVMRVTSTVLNSMKRHTAL